jgi:predicted dinucleotide-binding enzyme
MRIGILGSGLMGAKMGTIFARAGHDVTFSYSHDRKKLEKLARHAGKTAGAGTPAEAVKGADAVFLAVHWSRLDDVLKQAGSLKGKTVISCSLPMNEDESRRVLGLTTSGAETIARKAKGAHVVSAFSTVPSEVLFSVFAGRKEKTRPDLIYAGDNAKAKKAAARLIRDAGFNPVDVGKLSLARYIEPFTLLIAEIAYEGKHGPALAYHFEHRKQLKRA